MNLRASVAKKKKAAFPVRRGLLVVLSSPSGAGKTTVAAALLKKEPNLVRSVSCTTRPRRRGEKNGRDYFFVSKRRFEVLRREGAFLEWARVFDHAYGTPRRWVEAQAAKGKDVLFVIDVQGARALRRVGPGVLSLFLKPPSFTSLKKRLMLRRTETPAALALRLKTARREMAEAPKYDYRVVNDQVTKAVGRIRRILAMARQRRQ